MTRPTDKFYNRLSYTFGNEDPLSEQLALDIRPDDVVVAVTASGDRPLNLLINPCFKLYSIDLNPIQNHLLALKIEAMRHLDYDSYLKFLGASPDSYSPDVTRHILSFLPAEARAYWSSQQHHLKKGILYRGAMERMCYWISCFLNLFFKKEVDCLFLCETVADQKKCFEETISKKPLFRCFAHWILNPKLTKRFLSDPGLYEFVDSTIRIDAHLIRLIVNYLSVHLIRHNPILNLVFLGKVLPEAYPTYLRKEGVDEIKGRLNTIEIVHNNIIDFLEKQPEKSIDCFSLSDVASYMSSANFNRLLKAMIRSAKPNARFCIRELMSQHPIDLEIESKIQRNRELEEKLKAIDHCFVYRFITGIINEKT